MNATPTELPEPLYTFRFEAQGYSIALIPHSEQDRRRLKHKARKLNSDLAKFVRDEILVALSLEQIL